MRVPVHNNRNLYHKQYCQLLARYLRYVGGILKKIKEVRWSLSRFGGL